MNRHSTSQTPADDTPQRYFTIGDSIANQLGQGLRARGFTVTTFGIDGAGFFHRNGAELAHNIIKLSRSTREGDRILLLAGHNDLDYTRLSAEKREAYEARFYQALQSLVKNGAAVTVVGAVPFIGPQNGRLNEAIRDINAMIARNVMKANSETGAEKFRYIDPVKLSEDFFRDPSNRSGDGVHFTLVGSKKLADLIGAELQGRA